MNGESGLGHKEPLTDLTRLPSYIDYIYSAMDIQYIVAMITDSYMHGY